MIAMLEGSGQLLIVKKMHRSRPLDQETVTTLRARDPESIVTDTILSLLSPRMLPIVHMGLRARSCQLIEILPLGIETAGDKIEHII